MPIQDVIIRPCHALIVLSMNFFHIETSVKRPGCHRRSSLVHIPMLLTERSQRTSSITPSIKVDKIPLVTSQ